MNERIVEQRLERILDLNKIHASRIRHPMSLLQIHTLRGKSGRGATSHLRLLQDRRPRRWRPRTLELREMHLGTRIRTWFLYRAPS
jgi:hypothetical protein